MDPYRNEIIIVSSATIEDRITAGGAVEALVAEQKRNSAPSMLKARCVLAKKPAMPCERSFEPAFAGWKSY
jgi:hypothetical protein